MKKILVGLLTLAVGVSVSDFFYFVKESISDFRLSEQVRPVDSDKLHINSFISDKEIYENKTETFKPFFDSFEDAESFDGWFIANNFKGMKEVWAIDLGRDWADEKNEKLIWKAMIRTKNDNDSLNEDDYFHSISITANKSHLYFSTNKIRSIEYKFAGEFNNSFYKFEEGEKVLKGKLQKFANGKKVAEFTADFKFYEPHCLH